MVVDPSARPALERRPRRPHRMTPARRQALQKASRASAKARQARAQERKREWRRQHGYWFFHRWGLYAIPFTRTLKRLGESVPGFLSLLAHAERWLGPSSDNRQLKTANQPPPTGDCLLPTESWWPAQIAAKVARA